MKKINYTDIHKYRYILNETYELEHPLLKGLLSSTIVLKYITLTPDGYITIYENYRWDGPSGPTIDTDSFMRGSLIHDALYQLIRSKLLPISARKPSDKLLKIICRQDGMSLFRSSYVYFGVRFGGKSHV